MKYYGTIEKYNNYWLINAEPHVRIRLKSFFKKIYKNNKEMRLTDTLDVCKDIYWFIQRYPLKINNNNLNYLENRSLLFDKNQIEYEKIFLPEYIPKQINLIIPPRKYQSIAVDLFLKKKKLLVCDSVGLGKTLIAIISNIFIKKPTLIVCQTHLTIQWKEQFKKFTPDVECHIIKPGNIYDLPKSDVYICSYSKLTKWEDIFSNYIKYVVFDEVQELRRNLSKKYESSKNIANLSEYVLSLSATPIYNYGSEIFNILDIIEPGCLGSWSEFAREWCNYSNSENKVKVNDPIALGSFLRENYILIRRTREEVKQELPEVNKIVHNIGFNASKAIETEEQLKQIASRLLSDESTFVMRGQAARELDVRARYITGIAKSKDVANYVKIFLENDEKVLLAGWHRDVYDIWLKELKEYNPVLYTGSENANQKEKSKKDFINGDSKVMIISLRSGIGLDGLQQNCNVVIFGELDWSPGVHEQVIGRLHRQGQNNQVTAIFLASENGTDPLMIDILGLKASQSNGIINNKEDVLINNTDEDRLKKLAKKYIKQI